MPSVPLHGQRQRGKFGGERFAAKFCVICVTASLSFEFKGLPVTQIDSRVCTLRHLSPGASGVRERQHPTASGPGLGARTRSEPILDTLAQLADAPARLR